MSVRDRFHAVAHAASRTVGSPYAFIIALLVVVAWAVSGPAFQFSNTWQLIINTGTTVVTFLMVFMIQNTQNRDSHAIHLKLDELIRALDAARNRMVDIEDLPDDELARLASEFHRLRDQPDRPVDTVRPTAKHRARPPRSRPR